VTDSQLIREIKDGNIELYSELMRRYQRQIVAFIYQMLRNANAELLAEDLTSETFYKAYRSLNTFREAEATFSTWLYTIARNTVLSELRKFKGTVSLDDLTIDPVGEENTLPEYQTLKKERMQLVRSAINSLPEKQRSALILREYEQMEYQEIAQVLGHSVSSVKSLIFRARNNVKEQLEPYFHDSSVTKQERMGM
jgi:RNA polymerase sigma-70 factor (ECF subfamily)